MISGGERRLGQKKLNSADPAIATLIDKSMEAVVQAGFNRSRAVPACWFSDAFRRNYSSLHALISCPQDAGMGRSNGMSVTAAKLNSALKIIASIALLIVILPSLGMLLRAAIYNSPSDTAIGDGVASAALDAAARICRSGEPARVWCAALPVPNLPPLVVHSQYWSRVFPDRISICLSANGIGRNDFTRA